MRLKAATDNTVVFNAVVVRKKEEEKQRVHAIGRGYMPGVYAILALHDKQRVHEVSLKNLKGTQRIPPYNFHYSLGGITNLQRNDRFKNGFFLLLVFF